MSVERLAEDLFLRRERVRRYFLPDPDRRGSNILGGIFAPLDASASPFVRLSVRDFSSRNLRLSRSIVYARARVLLSTSLNLDWESSVSRAIAFTARNRSRIYEEENIEHHRRGFRPSSRRTVQRNGTVDRSRCEKMSSLRRSARESDNERSELLPGSVYRASYVIVRYLERESTRPTGIESHLAYARERNRKRSSHYRSVARFSRAGDTGEE